MYFGAKKKKSLERKVSTARSEVSIAIRAAPDSSFSVFADADNKNQHLRIVVKHI